VTAYEELRPRSTYRIMINHLQVSSLYISFKLDWPPIFLDVMHYLYQLFAFKIAGRFAIH